MKNSKIVKSLMACVFGAVVSLSGIGAASATPLEQACASFAAACESGEQFACERYRRIC